MDTEEQSRTYEAIRARDAAHMRLRRFTGGAVAVAVGLSAVFAALAANATHAKKTIVRSPAKRSAQPGAPVDRRARRPTRLGAGRRVARRPNAASDGSDTVVRTAGCLLRRLIDRALVLLRGARHIGARHRHR